MCPTVLNNTRGSEIASVVGRKSLMGANRRREGERGPGVHRRRSSRVRDPSPEVEAVPPTRGSPRAVAGVFLGWSNELQTEEVSGSVGCSNLRAEGVFLLSGGRAVPWVRRPEEQALGTDPLCPDRLESRSARSIPLYYGV